MRWHRYTFERRVERATMAAAVKLADAVAAASLEELYGDEYVRLYGSMVAEVVMTLRGFPGSGPGTLPFVLAQVAQSWTLYGGDSAPEVTKRKLAEEGRKYITATLDRFGVVRHALLASKQPLAAQRQSPLYSILVRRSQRSVPALA